MISQSVPNIFYNFMQTIRTFKTSQILFISDTCAYQKCYSPTIFKNQLVQIGIDFFR